MVKGGMSVLKLLKNLSLLLYFIISLFFMEIILKVSTMGISSLSELLFSLIFSISLSIILYIICSFFKENTNYTLSMLLLTLLSFIFSSQFIYYKFFKTFYTLYSAVNSEQVFEFWRDICFLILKKLPWILLFFLPIIFIAAFGRKILSFKKISWSFKLLGIFCALLFHCAGISAIYLGSRETNSPYDLYFNSNYPVLSVEKLGLITTARLDFQRLVFGFSPSLNNAPISTGDFLPSREIPLDNEWKPSKGKIEEEEKIDYNIMDIDFHKLLSKEKNETIKDMHKYFSKVSPTAQNDYTGKYKGYNLIFITAESFSPYAVREDVTPTLYKLVNEGYKFTNFYNPLWGVSTTDGEYAACTGLIPKSGVWSFQESGKISMPFALGNQLKKLGYKTLAYHNHSYSYYRRDISHPNMGYTYKGLGKGLSLKKTWPESDLEMMEKTIPEYIGNQPFHAYYMTVSGHLRYTFIGNSMAAKNKKYVKDLPYSEGGKAYIATQIELDKALELLLKKLDEAGIAEKTLIALSPDHYPYGLEEEDLNQLAGHTVEKNFELYKSTFILYTKGMEPVTIDKPCSSLDIMPTLSNLLGIEYDSRLLMGQDIFSDSEPLVVFLNKSFITDKGSYNSTTKEFAPTGGVRLKEDNVKAYIDNISSIVNGKFYYSAKILETDYYSKVLKK